MIKPKPAWKTPFEPSQRMFGSKIKDLQEAYGEAMLELRVRKNKVGVPVGQGRVMIEMIRQGLLEEGVEISISKICRYLEIARRTVYYRPVKSAPKVKPELEAPIKALIEQEPSSGYRTVVGLLGMNKNTAQRIFQLRGWQVRKRAIGFRPRIQALPSVATAPDQLSSKLTYWP